MHEFKTFSDAVDTKAEGFFYSVCSTPKWLITALSAFDVVLSSGPVERWHSVQISSETAEAKLRKHSDVRDITFLIDLIAASLFSDEIEARVSKQPNSIEIFHVFEDKLWLTAFKITKNQEVLFVSAYRVNARHLFGARKRRLVEGRELSL